MADAAKDTTQAAKSMIGEIMWTALLKLEGRGKTGIGQGQYRPVEGDQGGVYLPTKVTDGFGAPGLVRVTVTAVTQDEADAYFEKMKASLMGGRNGSNGTGSGRA